MILMWYLSDKIKPNKLNEGRLELNQSYIYDFCKYPQESTYQEKTYILEFILLQSYFDFSYDFRLPQKNCPSLRGGCHA